jgi:hypothetical protein
VRPWADTSPDRAADAIADAAWEPAHLLAVAAFVLLPLAFLALRAALAGTPEAGPATAAPLTTFGLGLLLLTAGEVLAAVAVRRSAGLPRRAGLPSPSASRSTCRSPPPHPELRIAHGVLVAVGCLLLAAGLRTASRR